MGQVGWQIRIKVRVPIIGWQGERWIKGQSPLGTVWFQLAITVPAIFGFDLEVAKANFRDKGEGQSTNILNVAR